MIKNTFWLLLAEGISKGSLAVLIIMIWRIFGKEVFGQYSYLSVILTFLVVFADLGITQLAIRDYQHIDEKHRRQYLVTGLWTKGLLSIAVTAVYIGILWFAADTSFLRLIGLILLTNNLTNSFLEYIRSTFRSLQKGETELRIKLIQWVGNLLLIPLLYVFQSLPLNLLGQSIVTIVTIGYARRLVRQRQLQTHEPEVMVTKTQLISNGRMFSMSMLFVSMYYFLDSLIIKKYWWYEQVGSYNAAYGLLVYVTAPMIIIWKSIYPEIRKNYISRDFLAIHNIVLKTSLITGFWYLILLLLWFMFSEDIMLLLYWPEYQASWRILPLLLCAVFINSVYSSFWHTLAATDKQKYHTLATLVAVILNLIANLIFVPKHWIIAAWVITICTELSLWVMIVYFYYANRKT